MDVRRELSTQAQSCLPCNRIACIDKVYGSSRLLANLLGNVLRCKGVVGAAQHNGVNAGLCLMFSVK